MTSFTQHTNYSFKPNEAFAELATEEQINAVRVFPVANEIRGPIIRGKRKAQMFIDKGIHMIQVTKTQFEFGSEIGNIGFIESNIIGPMVVIDRIEDRYSDNNGAYQIAYGKDANGNEMSESNMYDPSVVYVVGPIAV